MLKILRRIIADFKEYIIVVILVIISISILSSNQKPQVKRLRAFAFGSFALVNNGLSGFVSIFKSDDTAAELKSENARLMLEINRLRKQGLENHSLRSMLAFRDTTTYRLISASVISKLVTKTQGSYVLDRGSNEGITVGMPALNQKGLVGVVVDVAEDFCVIRTLLNSNLNIAVTIQRINVDGILSWNGNELVIRNIPTTYDVKVGDRVETSDFSSLFPPAVPIGVVAEKESNVMGLLHSLSIKPFADISAVDNLFIMKVVPSKQIDQLEMNLLKK